MTPMDYALLAVAVVPLGGLGVIWLLGWWERRQARAKQLAQLRQPVARQPRPTRFITPTEAARAVITNTIRTGLPHTATREPSGLYRVEEVGDG